MVANVLDSALEAAQNVSVKEETQISNQLFELSQENLLKNDPEQIIVDVEPPFNEALRSHILYNHVQEKPHKCPYCDYTATFTYTVKVHILNKYTEDKPHQCPQCDYTAAQLGNIKMHIIYKHTYQKPHKCPYCDHRTTESGNMKTHIRYKHTKEKPHQCPRLQSDRNGYIELSYYE
ncbi:unnamed protein product [Nezara viridula]|uniref:C2H2-type domain-containing protein n=1 Tax=Nezara viridula TaxID=85310 RepID=A0A9P0HS10_NEZVI|nr:unnamed protein product [Nezara viridula]